MRLIGKEKLLHLKGIDDEIDTWVSAWVTEFRSASWLNPVDLEESYPRMVSLDASEFLFPVCYTNYSIKVIFCFKKSIALITEVIANE